MELLSAERVKVCPLCKTSFACSPVDCWCSKLPAVMPMTEGGECYCPQCLEAIIEEKTKSKEHA